MRGNTRESREDFVRKIETSIETIRRIESEIKHSANEAVVFTADEIERITSPYLNHLEEELRKYNDEGKQLEHTREYL